MNCPQCNEMVGPNQWHVGEWLTECNCHGHVVGASRTLTIYCDFCGLFEAVEDDRGRIRSHVHYSNRADVNRLSQRIPALRRARRISA